MSSITITTQNSLPGLLLPHYESIRRIPDGVYQIAGRCIGPCGGPMWILRQGENTYLLDQAFYEWIQQQQPSSADQPPPHAEKAVNTLPAQYQSGLK